MKDIFLLQLRLKKVYFDAEYKVGGDYLYFGREDAGLPEELLAKKMKVDVSLFQ